jgi:hypothetical protein
MSVLLSQVHAVKIWAVSTIVMAALDAIYAKMAIFQAVIVKEPLSWIYKKSKDVAPGMVVSSKYRESINTSAMMVPFLKYAHINHLKLHL